MIRNSRVNNIPSLDSGFIQWDVELDGLLVSKAHNKGPYFILALPQENNRFKVIGRLYADGRYEPDKNEWTRPF